jgi:putative ABC transport system permease protein
VLRQLLTESFVLAAAGGALGIALAWFLVRLLPAVLPADFPRLADVRLDAPALIFASIASTAAGILAGMLPAARLAGPHLVPALREGSGASAGARARRIGAVLLVGEAAFAVMLLVGAGLLGRSFVRLLAVDPGYDPHHVLMARVHLPPQRAAAGDREEAFASALLDRVRALPGVTAAGASNMAPFVPASAVMSMTLQGDSAGPIAARAVGSVITPGYADALSMELRHGRLFDQRDLSAPIRPLLVNDEFARVYLSDGKPAVGRRFHASFAPDATVEIVGVVGNVLKDGLDAVPQPEIYNLPGGAFGLPPSINIAVRTTGDPLTLVAPLREAVRAIDPGAALDDVEPLGSRVSDSVREPRFATAVLIAFAAIATMLAAVGLYGVLSYQVWQRRRELGIRAALGASRPALLGLVLRQGLSVTFAGIVLGLVGAAWAALLMQGLLFGVTPHDPVAFGVAPIALLVVGALAALVPARRAASADPIEALRCE